MKLLITADLHNKKGLTAQLVIDYLDYLQEYYHENDIDKIIILGDIFHKNSNVKTSIFVPFFLKLVEMKESGINFIFVVGNHDIYNRDYDSLIDTFKPLGRVIKEYEEIELDGKIAGFLPYVMKEEDLPTPDKAQWLFTHLSIANFSFDNAYHATEKHAFREELFEDYSLVFTGHFHRHQYRKNIIYIGSPIQLSRGEVGQEKGFIVFDTDVEKWEFVEYDEAPKYIEVSSDDLKNLKNIDIKGNFAVVFIDEKIQDFAKLRYILYEIGAVDVIPVFLKEEGEIISEASIQETHDLEKITREFISQIEEENLDTNKLLKLFDEIASEVG